MYSTHSEVESVVTERFIRTLKNKIYKHMTAVSKIYFDVSDDFVNKYNNTYHRIIKMNPIDVTSNSYAEYSVDSNEKDPKLKVGDQVRISKYKNILAKGNVFFSFNAFNAIPVKCVSMNNKEYRIRPEIININSNEPTFYPYSIEVNKCSYSCNNINDPYAKFFDPDVVKNINIKVFNLMSRTNEKRHIKWHETCTCKCRLDASVRKNK